MPIPHPPQPSPEDARPPAEVCITELRVEPWPDGRRVKVHVTLTPFEQNPSLDAVLSRADGTEVTRAAIIELADHRFVFTLHIRTAETDGDYQLTATVTYPEIGKVAEQSVSFHLSQA
jgi:hypothetical protein